MAPGRDASARVQAAGNRLGRSVQDGHPVLGSVAAQGNRCQIHAVRNVAKRAKDVFETGRGSPCLRKWRHRLAKYAPCGRGRDVRWQPMFADRRPIDILGGQLPLVGPLAQGDRADAREDGRPPRCQHRLAERKGDVVPQGVLEAMSIVTDCRAAMGMTNEGRDAVQCVFRRNVTADSEIV